ncbi:hypothetical protein BESB_073310 [Besnoitia besnoiti]|uniref:Uncharacterized protein n=1 Tax=Besnoitia besnoiti TaxID=94643 RepID=A0A2A9M8C9_BESBE|nr:uncharacterized protein BESB_073310 [Besnoitia besnoiti]PFH34179.1 hypothetical protein BESB_073310 [Besnoitia besnoiti]
MLSGVAAASARALMRPCVSGSARSGVSSSFPALRSRFFSSKAGADGTVQMLVENPRPTQYQTEICNQATNVKPGVEKNPTKALIATCALLVGIPIIHTRMELNKYYSEVSGQVAETETRLASMRRSLRVPLCAAFPVDLDDVDIGEAGSSRPRKH